MPEMMYSKALETYADNSFFEDGMTARQPVEGSIARGYLPYPYPEGNEGYMKAGAEWKMPKHFKVKESLKKGKELYIIYCAICHGDKGEGDGNLIQREVFPPPPNYKTRLKDITEGQMYHSIYYGRNMMGAHASQLKPDERWQVIYYIQKLAGVGDFAN